MCLFPLPRYITLGIKKKKITRPSKSKNTSQLNTLAFCDVQLRHDNLSVECVFTSFHRHPVYYIGSLSLTLGYLFLHGLKDSKTFMAIFHTRCFFFLLNFLEFTNKESFNGINANFCEFFFFFFVRLKDPKTLNPNGLLNNRLCVSSFNQLESLNLRCMYSSININIALKISYIQNTDDCLTEYNEINKI